MIVTLYSILINYIDNSTMHTRSNTLGRTGAQSGRDPVYVCTCACARANLEAIFREDKGMQRVLRFPALALYCFEKCLYARSRQLVGRQPQNLERV